MINITHLFFAGRRPASAYYREDMSTPYSVINATVPLLFVVARSDGHGVLTRSSADPQEFDLW